MSTAVRLFYEDVGTGLPVVLLHGFPLNSQIWRKQQQALSDRYRVITPDLRGHGASPCPEGIYEMADLAGDVLVLLDHLKIERAVILGHSMGGYVTLAAWKLAPARFLGLGMVASQAAADTDEGKQGRFKTAEKVAEHGSQILADSMPSKLFSAALPATDPAFEQTRQMILQTRPGGIIGTLKGMAARADSTSILSQINVPALILAGADDQIIPRAKADVMAAAIPHATLAVIERAGHMPMLEQPDATTAAMRKFLETFGL